MALIPELVPGQIWHSKTSGTSYLIISEYPYTSPKMKAVLLGNVLNTYHIATYEDKKDIEKCFNEIEAKFIGTLEPLNEVLKNWEV